MEWARPIPSSRHHQPVISQRAFARCETGDCCKPPKTTAEGEFWITSYRLGSGGGVPGFYSAWGVALVASVLMAIPVAWRCWSGVPSSRLAGGALVRGSLGVAGASWHVFTRFHAAHEARKATPGVALRATGCARLCGAALRPHRDGRWVSRLILTDRAGSTSSGGSAGALQRVHGLAAITRSSTNSGQ